MNILYSSFSSMHVLFSVSLCQGMYFMCHSQGPECTKIKERRLLFLIKAKDNSFNIFQSRHLLIFFPLLNDYVKVKVLCHVRLFEIPWTIHGILQARILEWVAFPFSRGSSQPRDQTQVSRIAGRFFTN